MVGIKFALAAGWAVVCGWVAFWVFRDAVERSDGKTLAPSVWAALTFFSPLLGLPAYFYLRTRRVADPAPIPLNESAPTVSAPVDSAPPLRPPLWVFAFVTSAFAAAFATWLTLSRVSWPDSEFLDFAVFVIYLIVLLDLYFLFDQFVVEADRTKRMSLRRALTIFGSVLLFAPLVAMGPWALASFEQRWPWAHHVFLVFFFLSNLIALFHNMFKGAKNRNGKAPQAPPPSQPAAES